MLKPLVILLATISLLRAQTGDPERDRLLERAHRLGSTSYADYGSDETRLASDYEDLLKTYAANGVKYDFLKSSEDTKKFLDWRKTEFAKMSGAQKKDLAAYNLRLDQMVMHDYQVYKEQTQSPQDLARTLREMQSDQQLAKIAPRAWNMVAVPAAAFGGFMGGILWNQAVLNLPNKVVDSALGPYLNPLMQLISKKANAFYNRHDRVKPGRWAEWLNKESAKAVVVDGPKAQEALAEIEKRMPESFKQLGMTAQDFAKAETRVQSGLVLAAKESTGIFTDDQAFGRGVAGDAGYLREGNMAQMMGVFETKEGVANLNLQVLIEKWKNDAGTVDERRKVEKLAHEMLDLNKRLNLSVNQNARAQTELSTRFQQVQAELVKLAPDAKIRAADISDLLAYQSKKLIAARQIIGSVAGHQINKLLFPETAGRLPPEVGQWANVLKEQLGTDWVLAEHREAVQKAMRDMSFSISSKVDEAKDYMIQNKITLPGGAAPVAEALDADCVMGALVGVAR